MKILFFSSLLLIGGASASFAHLPLPSENLTDTVVAPAPVIIPSLVRSGVGGLRTQLIDTVVIHSSYYKSGSFEERYSLPKLLEVYRRYGVSAHYVIARNGDIYQLVPDSFISYHAGKSQMPDGRVAVNEFSLGIELINSEEDQFTEAQYQSLQALLNFLKSRYPIKNIVGHSAIAPDRKSDPWNFDWNRISAP